ncbi:hypothetical protein BDN72DRAFT_838430 [Pluteus cervinus]|uniref:Uncharacterized protein n=1 Tax=Pluteus cervinus TaxID=181527 RepID=A0ACD3AZ64_9AGAR|nr:hypothetical protein BDN72DRAFT_838430 [Pluteus cervinus]
MDSQNGWMTQKEVDRVSGNIFEHPTLDLRSIFEDFRLSGFYPTTDIPSHIEGFLKECQNDIDLLDTKIKSMISTIAQLSRELSEASARMVQKVSQVRLCQYLLSSPGCLPQDILEQIFLACLATNMNQLSPHPNRAPLQLAAVCHRWRTIALSMPLLWNGLYISTADHAKLAKTWASRCYMPSLSLKLNKNTTLSSSELQTVLDALQGRSLSPRRIELMGLGGTLGKTMEKFVLERDHPDLEEVVLRDSKTSLSSLPPASSASLRRIYTHMPPESWHHSPPPSQLTVLWLTTEIQYSALVVFLTYCPNLESLYVKLSEEGFQFDPELQVSTEGTMRRLSYIALRDSYDEGEPPEGLLRGFTFPSLQVVEFSQSKQNSTLWPGFVHSLTSVHRLTLQVPSLVPFVRLSDHATSLRELSISIKSNYMADALTCLASIVLPSLEILYLDLTLFVELTEWLAFEPELTALCFAWTTLEQGRCSLVELVIQHRYNATLATTSRDDCQDALKVKQMSESACPSLKVRIVSVPTIPLLGRSPMSFMMCPLPFNAVATHEVLEDDGSWREIGQPVHRVT